MSRGIRRLSKVGDHIPRHPLHVSVVIPFRNEVTQLPHLIGDLVKQSYPEDLMQVILVNDHSDDGSKELVDSLIGSNHRFICFDMPKDKYGKKEAISHAIQHASHSWIIQTDADSRVGEHYIASHLSFLEQHPSDLVAGLVSTYHRKGSLLEIFERLDLLSLVGTGAGSFHYNTPLMCNGANLAYSRELYYQTRQFDPMEKVVSGDDMFLMIGARKLGKKISYHLSREAMVCVSPISSLAALFAQRIRWGSKTTQYRMMDIEVLAVVVAITHMLVLLIPLWLYFYLESWPWLLSAYLLKTSADFHLIYRIAGHTGQRRSLWLFLPVSLLYYFYHLGILCGILFRGVVWKERKI